MYIIILLHYQLHYDREFQRISQKNVEILQDYIDSLNNSPEIYQLLKSIKSDNNIWESLNFEEQKLIDSSILELELSSCPHLSPQEATIVSNIQKEMNYAQMEFQTSLYQMTDENSNNNNTIEVSTLDRNVNLVTNESVIVNGRNFAISMVNWPHESSRREMYLKYHSNGLDDRFNKMSELRKLRHELSNKLGFDSFSQLKNYSCSFGYSRENSTFIENELLKMYDNIKNECIEEANELRDCKKILNDGININDNDSSVIEAWDIQLLQRVSYLKLQSKHKSIESFDRIMSSYLSLDQCLLVELKSKILCVCVCCLFCIFEIFALK